jgi:hypothetical protein
LESACHRLAKLAWEGVDREKMVLSECDWRDVPRWMRRDGEKEHAATQMLGESTPEVRRADVAIR